MSVTCVPIYGLIFRILTRFHALYFGAWYINRNSIVWRCVILARFPYLLEKRTWMISRYSYLLETLSSSEYGLTISGHVTVILQWLFEKNTDYIIRVISLISVPRNAYSASKSKAWQMDRQMDWQRKVIPMWSFALLSPQKYSSSIYPKVDPRITEKCIILSF